MSGWKKLAAASAAGGDALNVEDVFSTYLYTGDYNTGELNQHIKNNISLGSLGSGGSSVNFSGNQYITRSDFSGNSDGKELTFSAWILFNDFENNFVFSSDPNGGGSGINVGYFSGKLRFTAYNSSGSVISQWHVDDSNTPFHQWFHLCFSVNTASGTGATKVYINDVAATKESVTSSNQNIDRTRTVQRIAVRGTDYKLTGNLAHVFMDYTYRNLDTEANRRLFIDANGGSTDPSTLSALNPIMYCPLTDDYTMGKNLGTGGDFTPDGGPSFSSLGTEATGDASGGMVWIKNRSSTDSHMLFDTERGASKYISSDLMDQEVATNPDTLTQFLADGFFLGDDVAVNTNNEDYASWSFRKAPKFFDVVTWTGDGSTSTSINHSLGVKPGFIAIKTTNTNGNWICWARIDDSNYAFSSNPSTLPFGLGSDYQSSANTSWSGAVNAADETSFTPGSITGGYVNHVNVNNNTYVAYLWAHNDDDGEFGPEGDQDIIKCGGYNGNGSTSGTEIDLGFEPQWLLIKDITNSGGDWFICDTMRGIHWTIPSWTNLETRSLKTNETADEGDHGLDIQLMPNGFRTVDTLRSNRNNTKFIYVAIRRDTRVPTDGTDVFHVNKFTTTGFTEYTGVDFAPDLAMQRGSGTDNWDLVDKIRGPFVNFIPNTNSGEDNSTANFLSGFLNDGVKMGSASNGRFNGLNPNTHFYFKRAPGFFDQVAFMSANTPDASNVRVEHGLGVVPEMIWFKPRFYAYNWWVYHKDLGESTSSPTRDIDYRIQINSSNSKTQTVGVWGSSSPTATDFGYNFNDLVAYNRIIGVTAYLFATLPGVSKVGSYTGNGGTTADGASQDIDCGFSSGARFVLIKPTNAGDHWFVFDSARGIVAANDPYFKLNTSDPETSNSDEIDPLSSGFTVLNRNNQLNRTGREYIFYAIA